MGNIRSRWASNVRRSIHFSSNRALAVIALLTMAGCGGGGGGAAPTPAAAAPPETLFVQSNAWNGGMPATAETVTPDEFRRRQAAGELQVVTPSTQEAVRTTQQLNVESERAFLESKTDLSEEVIALLAESHAAASINGAPTATLPDGQKVALIDLGSRAIRPMRWPLMRCRIHS